MKRSLLGAGLRGPLSCSRISEFSLAFGLLLSVMLAGCAGSLDPGFTGAGGSNGGGMGGSADTGCQVAIFMDQCAGCHGAGTTGAAGLDLVSPNPAARMVDKMAAAGAIGGSCTGMPLLVRGSNPATGVFVDKVTMMTPPCGASMPYGSLPSAADQACLKTWATSVTTAPAAFSGQDGP